MVPHAGHGAQVYLFSEANQGIDCPHGLLTFVCKNAYINSFQKGKVLIHRYQVQERAEFSSKNLFSQLNYLLRIRLVTVREWNHKLHVFF